MKRTERVLASEEGGHWFKINSGRKLRAGRSLGLVSAAASASQLLQLPTLSFKFFAAFVHCLMTKYLGETVVIHSIQGHFQYLKYIDVFEYNK